jgi:RNA polymerase sigma-70 factor, ECF subfamily
MNVVAIRNADLLYEQAFQENWRPVFRFLLAWTNDFGAAEDLAQDAFVRLWKNRERVDWDEPILPWLLVTGRRLATDRFRALSRRAFHAQSHVSMDEATRVRWLDVQSAMSGLSNVERTALVLTTFEGSTTAEVAELLGCSDGAVRAAISRARQKLEDEQ